jgi:hypothetical protein
VSLSRRQVLAAVAATSGLAAVGAAGTATWATLWKVPAGEGLQALSDTEYAFVQALGEAWMPASGEPAFSAADADVGRFVDGMVGGMGPDSQTAVKALVAGLDAITWVSDGAPYRELPLSRRTELLKAWMHSDNPLMRLASGAVLAMVSIAWDTHPDVVAALNTRFPCGYGR